MRGTYLWMILLWTLPCVATDWTATGSACPVSDQSVVWGLRGVGLQACPSDVTQPTPDLSVSGVVWGYSAVCGADAGFENPVSILGEQ